MPDFERVFRALELDLESCDKNRFEILQEHKRTDRLRWRIAGAFAILSLVLVVIIHIAD
jgi:hypothetical protein